MGGYRFNSKECIVKVSVSPKSHPTHGQSNTKDYRRWQGMLRRCDQPSSSGFKDYGAKGITVCDRWKTFENYMEDMGPCPPGMSLDRKDSSKGYCPENCRWATLKQQNRNRSNTKFLTKDGVTRSIGEWAEVTGLRINTIWNRVVQGLPIEIVLGPLRTTRPKTQGEVHESSRIS